MEQDTSLESRRLARQATLDMLTVTWARGAGVGSFQFLFPGYKQHYPEIDGGNGERRFWMHAHDDLLEIPAEQGVAGLVIILAACGYLVLVLVRGAFWKNPLAGCLVYGAALTLVQAWWDFPFHCSAVFHLWWLLLVLAAMWVRFEKNIARA
jgi:O-antigen ligase